MQISGAAIGILWALKQVGKNYRLGAEVHLLPTAVLNRFAYPEQHDWDCSELVQAFVQIGGGEVIGDTPVAEFDGAGRQYLACLRAGLQVPVEEGEATPGAFLFIQSGTAYPEKPSHIGHVAISLGNGYCIEARGRAYGVVISQVAERFNLSAKIADLYREIEL